MTAPNAGLMQVEEFVRFSVVLVHFMRVRTRLPWVFDEITTPVEKQFGPSPMDGKTERAANPLREDALALLLGDVEEDKVLGAALSLDFFRWVLHHSGLRELLLVFFQEALDLPGSLSRLLLLGFLASVFPY